MTNFCQFFVRLLESAEGQRNTASYDWAEFFSRRLRENERTLVRFDSKNSIQESIRRVDPILRTLRAAQQIICRVYSVPWLNALW